jgi:hypothetical protein
VDRVSSQALADASEVCRDTPEEAIRALLAECAGEGGSAGRDRCTVGEDLNPAVHLQVRCR